MRGFLKLSGAILASIFVCGILEAAEESTWPKLELSFEDKFPQDNRSNYVINGDIDWQPGSLTILPGTRFSRGLNAGAWAELAFDIKFQQVNEENPRATLDFVWSINGETPCFIRWEMQFIQDGMVDRQLIVFDVEKDRKNVVLIRRWSVDDFSDGRWKLGYRHGLMTVSSPSERIRYVAHVEKGAATVDAFAFVSQQGPTTLSKLRVESTKPTVSLTEIQRQELASVLLLRSKQKKLLGRSELREADKIEEQVRKIYLDILGSKHPYYSSSIKTKGLKHIFKGEYSQAKLLILEALEIDKNVLGKEHPRLADSISCLGLLYASMQDFEKAEKLYKDALAIRKRVFGEKNLNIIFDLEQLAGIYHLMGDYWSSRRALSEALTIRHHVSGKENIDYATNLRTLALLNVKLGEYGLAKALYEESIQITRNLLGINHADYAINLSGFAILHGSMGDYDAGIKISHEALEISKNVFGVDHPGYATALYNLAIFHQKKKYYTNAIFFHKQSLDVRKSNGNKDPNYVFNLNGLGLLYLSMGDFVRAEPLLREACGIAKNVLGAEHPDYATCLNSLAAFYSNKGEYLEAEPLCREALKIDKNALGTEHPYYASSLIALARLYHEMGDNSRAEPFVMEAVTITRNHLERTALIQSERQQLSMLLDHRHSFNLFISLGQSSNRPATKSFAEELLWKGAIFVRQHGLRQLRSSGDPAVQQRLDELTETARLLAARTFQRPSPQQAPAWRKQLSALASRQEQLEAELSQLSTTFRQIEQTARITPTQLQTLLPPRSAIIDFVVYPVHDNESKTWKHSILAFVITVDQVEAIDLGLVSSAKAMIDQWSQEISQGRAAGSTTARELSHQLWEPLSSCIGDAETVLICPDGILNSVPFAALPGNELGSYLIEEKTIITIPFPQFLKIWQDAGEPLSNNSLLIVGNVDFDHADEETVPQSPSELPLLANNTLNRAATSEGKQVFPPLPGTRLELDQLSSAHQQTFAKAPRKQLYGAGATEDQLRQSASGQQIIHLATHGFFAAPEVISMARHQDQGPEQRLKLGANNSPNAIGHPPGVMSGVVLAGANKPLAQNDFTSDDGILTASEVQELNLDGTELVVLSACETGLGQVAGGEGVLGLQRAFHMAGARNVVTSLWRVNDDATAALMSLFYHNLWQKNQSPPVALRNAQLALLNHPEAIGDDEKLASLTTRGLDFSQPQKIDPKAKPRPQSKRTPIHLWAAFTHSGPPSVMAP